MTIAAITELDAVNEILAAVGSPPVSSLSENLPPDASISLTTLRRESKRYQTRGWHFNTDRSKVHTPDADKMIRMAPNVLRIQASDGRHPLMDLVLRNGTVYDAAAQTDEFTEELVMDVVLCLDWDSLPPPDQLAITTRTTRFVTDAVLGTERAHRIARENEGRDLISVLNYDAESRRSNVHNSLNPLRATRHIQRPI